MTQRMFLAPDADGYQSTDGAEWLQTALDGGGSRFRRDKVGAAKSVTVKWTLNRAQYQYWRSFYNSVGSATFTCPLLSEDGCGPVDQLCNIVPGSVSLPTQQGLMYVQQAQLEVQQLPLDPVNDASVMVLFSASEGEPDAWLAALAHMVNVTAPSVLS